MRNPSETGRPRLTEAEREKARRRARKSREQLTPEEDAAITTAAEADSDAQPVDELFRRKLGRPKAENPKKQIALRVDQDVLERFKAEGPGWQSRMNDALRKAAGL
ncbi:BrnA antitoxin family protein [Chelativorans sp. M5D2P16]|uniref:BrnA antitoxin family protein n=1 Tax=Chelativorans sp. M5D2P16 TaxID=3095678 RepID=UPI002ACAA04E|nr:BrnA antitoxin family protein [Chelativorans sp. M5D2P16]MDZ5697823.1 BrnA antitoxin family protein [Chelativorans sp. M5D2P16]